MTDSTPPRTLRDEVEQVMRGHLPVVYDANGAMLCLCNVKLTFDGPVDHRLHVADAILASFDIRPHNEPAPARVPEGMTAQRLNEIADALAEDVHNFPAGGYYDLLYTPIVSDLRKWAALLDSRENTP